MNYKFSFWELDVDVDATKSLYQTNDYAIDKKANEAFKNGLKAKHLEFFDSLAIDLDKISIDTKE